MAFRFQAVPGFPGLTLVDADRFPDARGWFQETWKESAFRAHGIGGFVQDNHTRNLPAGVVRGLHYQIPPKAQGKLVRCVQGRILDVAADLRRDSPAFGRWWGIELSAADGRLLWIPPGFAHGYCTLEASTDVSYKVAGAEYDPGAERTIRWDDPRLAVAWPVPSPIVAEKDARAPGFLAAEIPSRWGA